MEMVWAPCTPGWSVCWSNYCQFLIGFQNINDKVYWPVFCSNYCNFSGRYLDRKSMTKCFKLWMDFLSGEENGDGPGTLDTWLICLLLKSLPISVSFSMGVDGKHTLNIVIINWTAMRNFIELYMSHSWVLRTRKEIAPWTLGHM